MPMREILRQFLAGAVASVVFLVLFLGVDLVWWLAAGAAVVAFVGIILAVPKPKEAHEIELTAGISKADLDAALKLYREAADEMQEFSQERKLSPEMALTFLRLARIVRAIGDNLRDDPTDLRQLRGFTNHHLPELRSISRTFVQLRRAPLNERAEQRLLEIRDRITGYTDRFDEIYHACLDDDFQKLEISTKALDQIMDADVPKSARR